MFLLENLHASNRTAREAILPEPLRKGPPPLGGRRSEHTRPWREPLHRQRPWMRSAHRQSRRERTQRPADPAERRVHTPGGGRQKTEATPPDVIAPVQPPITERPAGDPMRQDVRWTDVTPQESADRLHAHAVGAGPRSVRRMRETLGVARRQIAKGWPGGDAPHRGEPVRPLASLLQELRGAGHPVLRIETKQKADVGTRARWEGLLSRGAQRR